MKNQICASCLYVLAVVLPLATMASDLPAPERIYSGTKSQTKTYMHQFVESPNGKKYAFRYFPGEDQPKDRRDKASPCEVWICNSDLTGHHKAFTSPIGELGHGSDVIVWVNDDLIYYAGISYEVSTRKVRWSLESKPLAKMWPVNKNKLYVAIRHGPQRGWYWLDPSSPTKPKLHLVSDMKNLVKHYKGAWENSQATYIHQNPSDTKLHAVVYDSKRPAEYAFILNAEDGSVHSSLGVNRIGYCANGHVLWYDDNTLMAGNRHPGLFDLNGKLIKRLASKGGHPSLSSDKKWWVAEIGKDREIRLHRLGSTDYTVISGDVKPFAGGHTSFSRDGKYVFFTGKSPSDPHPAVYRVDVSGITRVNNTESNNSEQSPAGDRSKAPPEE